MNPHPKLSKNKRMNYEEFVKENIGVANPNFFELSFS
jgi:hypothetical protein